MYPVQSRNSNDADARFRGLTTGVLGLLAYACRRKRRQKESPLSRPRLDAPGGKVLVGYFAAAFGKTVAVNVLGVDRYGRTVADVILPDGTNLNHALVVVGLGWWYQKYLEL